MAGARYGQIVVSASRKLKHEDEDVRKGLILNRDSGLASISKGSQTVKRARVHVEFQQTCLKEESFAQLLVHLVVRVKSIKRARIQELWIIVVLPGTVR